MYQRYLAIALAGLLAACDGQTPSSQSTTAETSTVSAQDLPRVAFGKPSGSGDFELKVKSVKQRSQIGAKGIGPATETGETFVVVRYSVKNIGKKPLSRVDLPSVELIDGAGQSYASDTEASVLEAALNNDIHSAGDINPNVSAQLTSVWKVDKASFDKAQWRLKASFDTGLSAMLDKAATWPLNDKAAPPLIFDLK